ncbi:MAG TPA: YciI family protein [Gemmataceae bacterium]|jgi:hypothetical protein|nr:YciI family protein [Gemmataceae bacterium]
MKYMMLIYATEGTHTKEEHSQCLAASIDLCHELASKGKYIAASPLHPVATATSVRVRNGSRVTTDGPFAETTEQLGGYYLVDAADLDEAIAIAGRIPGAKWGTVEIRPVVELTNMPKPK